MVLFCATSPSESILEISTSVARSNRGATSFSQIVISIFRAIRLSFHLFFRAGRVPAEIVKEDRIRSRDMLCHPRVSRDCLS